MQDPKVPAPSCSRPWQIIAQELNTEIDSKKVLELSEELSRALGDGTLDSALPYGLGESGSKRKPLS
jgi:hypothetical protein